MRQVLILAWMAAGAAPAWAQEGTVDQTITADQAAEFAARAPGLAWTVRVTGDGLLGADVQMGRYDNALRGRAFCAPTDLRWDGDRVTGLSGGAPVDLHYRMRNDELHIDGMYAGNLTHLRIGFAGIHGHIGPREYALDLDGGHYTGGLAIGSAMPAPASVSIPSALLARPSGEVVASLAILLAGFGGSCEVGPEVHAGPLLPPVVLETRPRQVPPRGHPRRAEVAPTSSHPRLDDGSAFRVTPPAGWSPAGTGAQGQAGGPFGGVGGGGGSSSGAHATTAAPRPNASR